MLTVLLIDDEYIVLKGMEAMLTHQRDVELRVIACLDSVEAIKRVPELRPDVIITDINMPELDGLTFIQRVLESGFDGRFILISGYEKVDYYKRAISLHVQEYLIKPIDKRKLMDALIKLSHERDEAKRAMLFRLKLLMTLNGRLCDDPLSLTDWRQFLEPRMILLAAQGLDEAAKERLAQGLSGYFPALYTLEHGKLDMLLCGSAQTVAREELRSVAVDCLRDGGAESAVRLGISESHALDELLDLAQRQRQLPLLAEAARDYLQNSLQLCASLADFPTHMSKQCDSEFLKEVFKTLAQEALEPADIIARGLIITLAAECVRTGFLPDGERARRALECKRLSAEDAQGLPALLNTLPELCRALASEDQQIPYSAKIQQAVDYIASHFSQDLSLSMVSEAIGLSQNYFSTLFNREVGVTFVDYLHGLRMEEACRLLVGDPLLAIESVSEMVGYHTIGHFYKTFKDAYGVSPKKWRQQRLGT